MSIHIWWQWQLYLCLVNVWSKLLQPAIGQSESAAMFFWIISSPNLVLYVEKNFKSEGKVVIPYTESSKNCSSHYSMSAEENGENFKSEGMVAVLGYLFKDPFPFTGLLSWPNERISCILSGQSEFNLRAKSSTSLSQI